MAGVCKRIANQPPEPKKGLLREFATFVKQWLVDNLVPLSNEEVPSVEQWLANTTYRPSRVQELLRVAKRNRESPNCRGERRQTKVSCFVKEESYIAFKYPRCIFSRADDFKVNVGPIFSAIEHLLFQMKYFIKYVPVRERGKFVFDRLGQYEGWKTIATDYSAFESQFTRPMMKACEFQLYQYMTKHLVEGPDFMKLINNAILGQNNCSFKRFDVKIPAGRMSGEMNTSLGNGFTNLMVFLFLNSRLGNMCDCLVEGDDMIACYRGKEITAQMYSDLGFNVKLQNCEKLNTASFCGQIFDLENRRVICDPLKILLNFGWTSQQYANAGFKVREELRNAKAMSFLAQYPGCPIVSSFCEQVLRCSKMKRFRLGTDLRHFQVQQFLKERYFDVRLEKVTMSSRILMEEVFGFTISEQLSLEAYFDELSVIKPISHPIITSHCTQEHFDYNDNYVGLLRTGESSVRDAIINQECKNSENQIENVEDVELPLFGYNPQLRKKLGLLKFLKGIVRPSASVRQSAVPLAVPLGVRRVGPLVTYSDVAQVRYLRRLREWGIIRSHRTLLCRPPPLIHFPRLRKALRALGSHTGNIFKILLPHPLPVHLE
jgi:hypothetical protein